MSLSSHNPFNGRLIYKKITEFEIDRLTSMGTVHRFSMKDGVCPDLEIIKFYIYITKYNELSNILNLVKLHEPHSVALDIHIQNGFDIKALEEFLNFNYMPNLLKIVIESEDMWSISTYKNSIINLPQILTKNPQIRILSLKGFFSNEMFKKLFSSKEFQDSINELDISFTGISDCNFEFVMQSIAINKNLKKLSFSCHNNGCSSFNLSKLKKPSELFRDLSFERLHVHHDAIPSKPRSYINFVEALCYNTSLKSIDLDIANLDEGSAGYILDNICQSNTRLQNLKLSYYGPYLLNQKFHDYVQKSQGLSNFILTSNSLYIRLETMNLLDNTKIKYLNFSGVIGQYTKMFSFLDENFISKQNQMSIRHLELGCSSNLDLTNYGENTKNHKEGLKLVQKINSIKNALALITLKIYLLDYKIELKQINLKYFPNLLVLKNQIIDDNYKISQKIVEHILIICNDAKTRKEIVDGLKFKNISSFKSFMLRNFSVRFIMQAVYLLHQGAIDYIFDNIAYANREAIFKMTFKNNNLGLPKEIIDHIGYYLNKANMEDMSFVQYLNNQRNNTNFQIK